MNCELTWDGGRDLTARMQASLHLAILLGAGFVSGCARDQVTRAQAASVPGPNTTATNATLIVTPEEGLNGKVTWVNANLRFVVITFPVGQMPVIDRRLNVYRDGLKVGEIRISGPQSDDSIVADIVAGEATTGDAIRNN
jgi:hypothetical protein